VSVCPDAALAKLSASKGSGRRRIEGANAPCRRVMGQGHPATGRPKPTLTRSVAANNANGLSFVASREFTTLSRSGRGATSSRGKLGSQPLCVTDLAGYQEGAPDADSYRHSLTRPEKARKTETAEAVKEEAR
jgi:hypothetical protein